ncbi:MAG: hypothetical protein J7M09_04255 [Deltaproteobacteria bacterium]|nr:hypothetical protein [Candidatus Tharpella sp.]
MKVLRILLLASLALLLTACAGMGPVDYAPTQAERLLDQRVDLLLDNLLSDQHFTSSEMAPAAIVPGSAMQGEYFSRLEELLCERLETRLRESHNIFKLSRQNWFELRAGHALSFQNQPLDRRQRLRAAIIYQVEITADTVLDRVNATITARYADGQALTGVVASGPIGFGQDSLARQLYYAAANRNPFPEGLEERPYSSLDRLAYSLTSELSEAYRNGLRVGGQNVADREVKVLLYTASSHYPTGLTQEIQSALQQALISQQGFTCVVSRQDFGPALQQVDFYQWHSQLFKPVELPQFEPGTVLLMVDISQPLKPGTLSLAMRAIWRTDPLEDQNGNLINEDASGTYVSGFTAKAYFAGDQLNYRYGSKPRITHHKRRAKRKTSTTVIRAREPWSGPSTDINLCFYDFTETLRDRIYPVLNQAPGVTWLRRADELCDRDSDCLCYEIWYTGTREDMSAWLKQYLRTSKSVNFRLTSNGPGRIEVHFDGGFN